MIIRSAKDLIVYQRAYEQAMDIFHLTKAFPRDERYSLIDQMRRSSRSVCANLREAWAKRRYEAHFISKLSDADGENGEVETWLDLARDCGYLGDAEHDKLIAVNTEVGKMLGSMMALPDSFLLASDR